MPESDARELRKNGLELDRYRVKCPNLDDCKAYYTLREIRKVEPMQVDPYDETMQLSKIPKAEPMDVDPFVDESPAPGTSTSARDHAIQRMRYLLEKYCRPAFPSAYESWLPTLPYICRLKNPGGWRPPMFPATRPGPGHHLI